MHEDRDAFLARLKGPDGAWPDFEGMIQAIYASSLRPGDCAVDVGVNEGHHFYCLAQAVGPTGRVIGVEASPKLSRAVEDHFRASWPELWSRVVLHNVAVGDHEGEAILHFNTRHSGLSSLAQRDVSPEEVVEKVRVPMTTLDRLLDRAPRFVKLDIEGAEFHALKGAARMLDARPLMAFEFDRHSPDYFHYSPDDLVGLFSDRGYTITDLFGHPHPTAQDLMDCPTWNFLAIPPGADIGSICASARARALNPNAAQTHAPTPSEADAAAAFVGRIAEAWAGRLFRHRAVFLGVRAAHRAVKRLRGRH